MIEKNELKKQKIKTNIVITGRPTGFVEGGEYDKFLTRYEIEAYNEEQIDIFTKLNSKGEANAITSQKYFNFMLYFMKSLFA